MTPNGMYPPARVEATRRWVSPQNMNPDNETGDSGSNSGHYFVPLEDQQTGSGARKLPSLSHGQPPISIHLPHTVTQSDSAKHQQPFPVKLPEWKIQAETERLRRFSFPGTAPLAQFFQAPPSPPPSSTATPPPPPWHTPPTSTTKPLPAVPPHWYAVGMPATPTALRQTLELGSQWTSLRSETIAQAAYLRSKSTSPTPFQQPQSALKIVDYWIPPALPRWTTIPLPPEKRSVRFQRKPKAPLQARPHDRWLTTVEESDIENDHPPQTHLKGWLPVIEDIEDADDSDIENEPLLQTHLQDRWPAMIEDPDIENDDLLQTHLKGRLPVIDDSNDFDDFDDSNDSDDSDIENEPLLQTRPHDHWLPVIDVFDYKTTSLLLAL